MIVSWRSLVISAVIIAAQTALAVQGGEVTTSPQSMQRERTSSDSDETTTAEAERHVFPLGNATENRETSAGIVHVLEECAAQYRNAQAMHAAGTYIEAMKGPKVSEKKTAARLQLDYVRPDRLRVELTDEEFSSTFVADGSHVLMLWPAERKYTRLPQPDSLAAFSEMQRAGEILDDESAALSRSLIASLLITDDPLAWLHANVVEYHYEGIEVINGAACFRIKFVQNNPEMIVTNWIDRSTYLLRQVAITTAYASGGTFVHSYQSGSAAIMRLTILDSISTAPEEVDQSAFDATAPRGWTIKRREQPAQKKADRNESQWLALLRAAAAHSEKSTSVALTRQFGELDVQQESFYPTSERVLFVTGSETNGKQQVLVGLANRQLLTLENGTTSSIATLPLRPDVVTSVGGKTPRLIVAQNDGYLAAVDLTGKLLWQHDMRWSVKALLPANLATSPSSVYVAGERGLAVLQPDGKLAFSSRLFTDISGVTLLQTSTSEPLIAAAGEEGLAFFSDDGRFISKNESAGDLRRVAATDAIASAPLMALSVSGQSISLHGLERTGDVDWTVGVAYGETQIEPVGLAIARVKHGGATKPVAVVALSDGVVAIFAPDGEPLWKGRIAPADTAAGIKLETFAHALATADTDNDASDEIYIALDTGVAVLKVK